MRLDHEIVIRLLGFRFGKKYIQHSGLSWNNDIFLIIIKPILSSTYSNDSAILTKMTR